MSAHLYGLAGLTLSSPRPLPYLAPVPEGSAPDVAIAFGPVPETDAGARIGLFEVHGPDLVDFRAPGLAIRIADGRRMTVDAAEGLEAGELHTFLFGPAFAALLYQRGCPPLHAGAARFNGGAVAVAGHSGAGKSTTIRTLLRRGCDLLCDDQLVVEPASGLAQAGFPAMKLWSSAGAHFGERLEGAARVRPGLDKFHVHAADGFAPDSAPLRLVCVLVTDAETAAPRAERLSIPQAVAALGGLAHHAYVADAMGRRPVVFQWAAALAGRVPVFLLRRPDDLAAAEAVGDLVLRVAEQLPAEASP